MIAAIKGAAIAKNQYDNMTPKQKQQTQVIALVGLLGVLYLGNKVVKGWGKGFDLITGAKAEEERKQEEQKLRTEIKKDLVKSGEKPTISEAKAKQTAQSLYSAMKGLGTNEAQIIYALNVLKNASDYMMLGIAYGMPRGRSLTAEFYHELDAKELRVIRALLKKRNVEI